jgi:hypothetical protein
MASPLSQGGKSLFRLTPRHAVDPGLSLDLRVWRSESDHFELLKDFARPPTVARDFSLNLVVMLL